MEKEKEMRLPHLIHRTIFYSNVNAIFIHFFNEKLLKMKKHITKLIKSITECSNIAQYSYALSIGSLNKSYISPIIRLVNTFYLKDSRILNILIKKTNIYIDCIVLDIFVYSLSPYSSHGIMSYNSYKIEFYLKARNINLNRFTNIVHVSRVIDYDDTSLSMKTKIDEFSNELQEKIEKSIKFIKERRK